MPGIFVKYDFSGLKVKVKEEHKPYWHFLVRMCGIVGGVFATSGKCSILLFRTTLRYFLKFCVLAHDVICDVHTIM